MSWWGSHEVKYFFNIQACISLTLETCEAAFGYFPAKALVAFFMHTCQYLAAK
jgi:hypothetical protein